MPAVSAGPSRPVQAVGNDRGPGSTSSNGIKQECRCIVGRVASARATLPAPTNAAPTVWFPIHPARRPGPVAPAAYGLRYPDSARRAAAAARWRRAPPKPQLGGYQIDDGRHLRRLLGDAQGHAGVAAGGEDFVVQARAETARKQDKGLAGQRRQRRAVARGQGCAAGTAIFIGSSAKRSNCNSAGVLSP